MLINKYTRNETKNNKIPKFFFSFLAIKITNKTNEKKIELNLIRGKNGIEYKIILYSIFLEFFFNKNKFDKIKSTEQFTKKSGALDPIDLKFI